MLSGTDIHGNAALHICAATGNEEAADLLIKAGLGWKDQKNWCNLIPFQLAIVFNKPQLTWMLLPEHIRRVINTDLRDSHRKSVVEGWGEEPEEVNHFSSESEVNIHRKL